ncbi:MAG: glycosyltransferase family 1 protein [Roseburia sp.]|nr:glycosyltransferase family 1 protein [Roseburia sp.]
MEPIRVLQIVTTMERAGLETMLMNYYRHIDRTKVQFDFLKHRDGIHAYDEEIKALGGNIYTVPSFHPLNANGYLDALDTFFREHNNYSIVHCHLDCLSAVPLKYAKKYGITTRIAHSHVSKMTFDLKYPVRAVYRSQIPFVATDMFACSDTAGKWMFGKHAFRVVTNAIDSEAYFYDADFAERIRKENNLNGQFVVAHIGRFDPVKNHTFLLDVFREVVNRHENSILLLAGVGSTMNEMKAKAETYGLKDRVRFLGSVSNIPDLLQMSDVFVFPSRYEGLGISLMEAQAAGLSCFASKGRIPKEADVTGNVKFLSLESGAKVWADQILKVKNQIYLRNSNKQVFRDSGYDISVEAKKLQEIYTQKYMEKV